MASYVVDSIEGSVEGSGLHSSYGCMVDDSTTDIDDKIKSGDSKWYIFDNLLCNQAEDLLHHHGNHGTYLFSHFHDTDTYTLSIRLSEGEEVTFKHYAITTNTGKFTAEELPDTYPDLEGVVEAVKHKLAVPLLPIFHQQRVASLSRSVGFEITLNEDDKPPEYTSAAKYPEAAKKPLPLIVPVYPTLRRMMRAERAAAAAAKNSQEASDAEATPHDCCWKAFHTDVNGRWYKPHKAGPVMAGLLVVGWILFLVFFGWVVGLALLLVLLLTLCACFVNFLCTGKCQVEDDSEEQQQQTEGQAIQGNQTRTPQNYGGAEGGTVGGAMGGH